MLGDALIGEIADGLRHSRERPAVETGPEPAGDTTHLCVADDAGNIVSLTQSIQSLFGAKVAHPKLGFFYNNYLTTCLRRQHPQQLAGGCVPRSNLCPTIVVDAEGAPRLAVGGAGSRRIISGVLQVIGRVIERGETLGDAVAAPRVHALLNGKVWIERPAITTTLAARLSRRYRSIVERREHDYKMGCIQALAWDSRGRISTAADPRRDGTGAALNAAADLDPEPPASDTRRRNGGAPA